MFKLFKRKNEVKELKSRVAALETKVTALNSQIENSKSWGDGFNLKGYTFEGAKLQCKKCNKESSTIEAKISDLVATPAKVDELKVESNTNGDLILQIDGSVRGKVALEQSNKMTRQSENILVNI